MFGFRTVWIYLTAVLLMYLLLSLSFYVAFMVSVELQPEIKQELAQLIEIYDLDPAELSASDTTESELRERVELMTPVLSRIDWLVVGLVASLLAFSLLGLFCGRLSGDPRWVGVLPLVALFTNSNPAVLPTLMENQGVHGVRLSFQAQVVLLGVQLLVAYLGAEFGARLLARKRRLPPDSEAD